MPPQTRKTDHNVGGVRFVHLEELSIIHNQMDDILDVIRLDRIIRDNRIQGCLHPQWVIPVWHKRRVFHVVLRQIRKQFAGQVERIGFAIGGEVTDAGYLGMNRCAAQFLEGDLFMGDGFNHLRSGHEHIRRVAHHDNEIGKRRRVHCAARARSHDDANLGNHTRRQGVAQEYIGVAAQRYHAFLDARSAGVVQTDDGGAVLHGDIHDFTDFLCMSLAEAAAEHGEVLREYIHQASVNCAPPGDHAIAEILLLIQTEIGCTVGDKSVYFPERAFVYQEVYPLTGGQPAAIVLGLNAFRTASLAAFSFQSA